VIFGAADIYRHSAGQFESGSCMPVAVAQTGAAPKSHRSQPLAYNRADTDMPDLLIRLKEHAKVVLSCLKVVQPA
jgi:3'(2'), 5'-bisphosphate nucleotidase